LLSLILTLTTLFPSINVTSLAAGGGVALAGALVVMGLLAWRTRRGAEAVTVVGEMPQVPKEQWTMPPATLLSRPPWSTGRRIAMSALGVYMVVALALLIVKSVQLAGG